MGGVGGPACRKAAGHRPGRSRSGRQRARTVPEEGRNEGGWLTEDAEAERPHGRNRAAHRVMRIIPPMSLGRRDVTTTLPRLTRVRRPRPCGGIAARGDEVRPRFRNCRPSPHPTCDFKRSEVSGDPLRQFTIRQRRRPPPIRNRSGPLLREGVRSSGRSGGAPADPAPSRETTQWLRLLIHRTEVVCRPRGRSVAKGETCWRMLGIQGRANTSEESIVSCGFRTLRSRCRHTSDDCPRGCNPAERPAQDTGGPVPRPTTSQMKPT